jgi:hypothetical protein
MTGPEVETVSWPCLPLNFQADYAASLFGDVEAVITGLP